MKRKLSVTERAERARERLFELIEQAQSRNEGVPSDVIEKEVDQAVREVRLASR